MELETEETEMEFNRKFNQNFMTFLHVRFSIDELENPADPRTMALSSPYLILEALEESKLQLELPRESQWSQENSIFRLIFN